MIGQYLSNINENVIVTETKKNYQLNKVFFKKNLCYSESYDICIARQIF